MRIFSGSFFFSFLYTYTQARTHRLPCVEYAYKYTHIHTRARANIREIFARTHTHSRRSLIRSFTLAHARTSTADTLSLQDSNANLYIRHHDIVRFSHGRDNGE